MYKRDVKFCYRSLQVVQGRSEVLDPQLLTTLPSRDLVS